MFPGISAKEMEKNCRRFGNDEDSRDFHPTGGFYCHRNTRAHSLKLKRLVIVLLSPVRTQVNSFNNLELGKLDCVSGLREPLRFPLTLNIFVSFFVSLYLCIFVACFVSLYFYFVSFDTLLENNFYF